MPRAPVDLSSHLNLTVERGHPADFPVSLRPVAYVAADASFRTLPNRLAVVRDDTGEVLSLVSDRYTFISHQQLLDAVTLAIASLDAGPVPRGIYVDRQGARMRAVFKFPALSQALAAQDEICPCVKIVNTYDGTSQISVSIGAFRFVCTNLAVGGGGVFAGGFVSIHAGEIPVAEVGQRLALFLSGFDVILATYRAWMTMPLDLAKLSRALRRIPDCHLQNILAQPAPKPATAFSAYNAATAYATHQTRSAVVAFTLLDRINSGFQEEFPVPELSSLTTPA